MALPISVTYTFATATSAIPLSQLDANFTTVVNGVNGIGNGTNSLSNVVITGGTIDGTTIGATTSSTGRFSTVTATTGNLTTVNATTLNAATHRSDTSLTFQTNGTTTAMTIDASQNVGIGTSSPATKLQVNGFANGNAATIIGNASLTGSAPTNTGSIRLIDNPTASTAAGGIEFLTSTFGSGYGWKMSSIDSSGVQLTFSTRQNSATWSEQMRIDASGNVGIGLSNPNAYGSNVNVVSSKSFVAGGASTGYGFYPYYVSATNYAAILGDSSGSMTFTTGTSSPTERARIDSSGNLCVNTTSATGKANIYAGSAGQIALYLNNANASSSANPVLYCVKFDNTNTTSQVYAQFAYNAGGAGGGQINGNGANQAAFGGFSDIRLKENVVNLPPQLDKICSLRPVEFDFKNGSGHQIGFIAQEMQEVYPDVVGEGADEMLTITGWSKTEARLVAAIQELKAQNDELKARVAALENA
jgi:hypothetical protein